MQRMKALNKYNKYEKDCLIILKIRPFGIEWRSNTQLFKDLIGDLSNELYHLNKDELLERVDLFKNCRDILDEVEPYFDRGEGKYWRRIQYLTKVDGSKGLFETTIIPHEWDIHVKSVMCKTREIELDSQNMPAMQEAIEDYYSQIYKAQLNCLTKAERKVFAELVKGNSVKEIGEKFHRSKHTIETHSANIKKKLDCDNIYQLMNLAYKMDLIV